MLDQTSKPTRIHTGAVRPGSMLIGKRPPQDARVAFLRLWRYAGTAKTLADSLANLIRESFLYLKSTSMLVSS